MIEQARDGEGLPVRQLDRRRHRSLIDDRDARALDDQRAGEIQVRHFGRELETDLAVAQHHRDEVEANAELAVLDGDGCPTAAAGLRNRDGKFAACQKAGLLAAHGNQVRLGEDAQQVVLAQGLDEVSEGDLPGHAAAEERHPRRDGSGGDVADAGLGSVTGRIHLPDVVPEAEDAVGHGEVDPQRVGRAARDFGKAHLKHDLLSARDFDEVEDLGGVRRRHARRLLGGFEVRRLPAQRQRPVHGADGDLGAGEDGVQVAL